MLQYAVEYTYCDTVYIAYPLLSTAIFVHSLTNGRCLIFICSNVIDRDVGHDRDFRHLISLGIGEIHK